MRRHGRRPWNAWKLEERIQAILLELDEMIGGGLITLERAQVLMHRLDSATS